MKYVLRLVGMFVFIGFFMFASSFADSNGIWHYANDVRPGTFGSDEYAGDYSFDSKVGVGTNSPISTLHVVNGYGGAEGKELILETSNVSNGAGVTFSSLGTFKWAISARPAGAEREQFVIFDLESLTQKKVFVIEKDGNVGIATAAPSQKLDVNGKIRMQSQTVATDADDIVATKRYVDLVAGGGSSSLWSQSGSNVYYNSGNVGIGNVSPGASLHIVNGNTGATGKELILESSNPNNGAGITFKQRGVEEWAISARPQAGETGQFAIFNMEGPTKVLAIEKNGNVGIGTAAPSQKLDVAGKINMQSATQKSDGGNTVVTKEGLGNLIYEKENFFTPSSDWGTVTNDVYCDAGDVVISCSWMPSPGGDSNRRIHSYHLEGSASGQWYSIGSSEILSNPGCRLGVENYIYHKATWSSFYNRVVCLDIT